MSLQPMGSTEQTLRWRRSRRFSYSSGEIFHFLPSFGRHDITFCEKGLVSMLYSWRIIAVSVDILPSRPIILTNWPCGKGLHVGHEVNLTMSLLPSI